jgi:hypothetical protein
MPIKYKNGEGLIFFICISFSTSSFLVLKKKLKSIHDVKKGEPILDIINHERITRVAPSQYEICKVNDGSHLCIPCSDPFRIS